MQIQQTVWQKEGDLDLSESGKLPSERHLSRGLKNSKSDSGRGSTEGIVGSNNNT